RQSKSRQNTRLAKSPPVPIASLRHLSVTSWPRSRERLRYPLIQTDLQTAGWPACLSAGIFRRQTTNFMGSNNANF
ncbi:hypothetical protein, partial [Ensifer sp. ZNC0028]|uniref:hypothetical protein n=1 Tax=Ensifer sp. ZNC0028 TaxID=1339236 RepID=UPI001AEC698C